MFGIARLDGAPSPWSIVRFSEKLAKGHAARTSASDSAPSLVTVIDKTTSVPTASVGATHACDTVMSAPTDRLTPKNKISSAPDPTIAGRVDVRRLVRRYSKRVELMELYFENMRRGFRRFQSIQILPAFSSNNYHTVIDDIIPVSSLDQLFERIVAPPFHSAARAGQVSHIDQAVGATASPPTIRRPSHSAIRPSRLNSRRERSVRRSFSHNRPFGKSRGVCG